MEVYFEEWNPTMTKRNVANTRALTVMQVAEILNCHRATVCVRLNEGTLRGFKLGRNWRVTPEEVERFMEKQRSAA